VTDVMDRLRAANPVPRDRPTGWDRGTPPHVDARRRRSRVPAALVAAALVVVIAATVAIVRDPDDARRPGAASTIDRLVDGTWSRLPDLPWRGPGTPIWTGRALIVWGSDRGAELVDGKWRLLPDWGFGDRSGAIVRWIGNEMVVLGGADPRVDITPTYGAAYDPDTRKWRSLPAAPIAFGTVSTATWTGGELVVTSAIPTGPLGASYDPLTDQWQVLPAASPSPQGNSSVRAAWNGREVLFTMVAEGRAQAITYNPRRDTWSGSPPMTATEYGPNDLARTGRWLLQVIWRMESNGGYLEVARRRPGGGGFEKYTDPSICGVRTTTVPGGVAISCTTTELRAMAAEPAPLVSLPTPPVPVGEMAWTKAGLVAVSEGGRVARLS
jgi:hypothetical protein